MSFAEIFDPISGKIFAGGLFQDRDNVSGVVYWDGKLQTTDIHNFDIRWEVFQDKGQMFSVSGFYKKFYKPIEIVQFVQMVNAFQPRNVGDGRVFGAEFEARKNLNFISPYLSYLTLVTNVSLISSRIEMTNSEFESRKVWARQGEQVDNYREMAGQSPYLVNAGILFEGIEKGFFKDAELALFYNMQGPTLQIVGIVDRPDIYSLPFHSLNFNASKKFGKSKRAQIGIKIDNLLNQSKKSVFRAYNTQDEYDEFLNPGRKFQLRFQYNIF
jgi:outer membrane receptor protein involved in Fe transport